MQATWIKESESKNNAGEDVLKKNSIPAPKQKKGRTRL